MNYNLIVGTSILEGSFGTVENDRFPHENWTPAQLTTLPTLVIPERNRLGDSWDHGPQIAQLGHVSGIVRMGGTIKFRFTRNNVPAIPLETIYDAKAALNLREYDFTRTQWQVKDGDLYQALVEADLVASQHARPTAFKLPMVAVEKNRIAAMMPFESGFTPVWTALQETVEQAKSGWQIDRADSIWEAAKVMDDVALLIARSKVIIADLSGKNANVFYETGLAHMLGRTTVLITQNMDDVPFDLRSERVLKYLPNEQGLLSLQQQLAPRLKTLLG